LFCTFGKRGKKEFRTRRLYQITSYGSEKARTLEKEGTSSKKEGRSGRTGWLQVSLFANFLNQDRPSRTSLVGKEKKKKS